MIIKFNDGFWLNILFIWSTEKVIFYILCSLLNNQEYFYKIMFSVIFDFIEFQLKIILETSDQTFLLTTF